MKSRHFLSLLLLLFMLPVRLPALSVGVIEPDSLKDKLLPKLKELWFDNAITFGTIEDFKDDVSTAEMSLLAQRNGFDFILYGFSEQNEAKCSVELRLLEVESHRTEKFFYASDSSDAIPRLSATLAGHIHDYLCERFSIERVQFTHFYKLDVTLSAGYWTYTGTKWTDLFLGIVAAHAGIEFHPALDFQLRRNDSADFSVALNGGYKFARGRDRKYNALLHAAEFTLPVMFNWNPTALHSLKAGIGPAFQCGVVDWTPLYEDSEIKSFYQWGIASTVQGRVFVSQNMGLSLALNGNWYPVDQSVPEISFEMGIVFTPLQKEALR